MYKIVLPEGVEYFPSQVCSVTFLPFSCYLFLLLALGRSLTISPSVYMLLSPFYSGATVRASRSKLAFSALVYGTFDLTTALALVSRWFFCTWLAVLVSVILLGVILIWNNSLIFVRHI